MDAFGFTSADRYSYSDTTTDRYGFSTRPTTKITVSSSGEVSSKELPPITSTATRRYRELDPSYVRKIFSSPWLKDYRDLGEALIHAINEDKYQPEVTSSKKKEGFSRTEPYFVGCTPKKGNVTIFNGHNIHISLFLTEENQEKNSREILLFGDIKHKVPEAGFIFNIIGSDKENLGKAYSKLVNRDGRTIVRINRIIDFSGNPSDLSEFPVNSNFLAAFDLKGTPPPDDFNFYNKGDDKPYFKDRLWDEENYAYLRNGHLVANIVVPQGVKDGKFHLPITGITSKMEAHDDEGRGKIKMEAHDDEGRIIGSALVYIDDKGEAEIMALKKREEVSEDFPIYSLYCYTKL